MSEPRNFFCAVLLCYTRICLGHLQDFFFCCSFCPLWCKSVPVHLLLSYLIGLSPRFFFCCCSFCSLWSKNDIGRSSVKCPCTFDVKHRWARYVVCFYFFLIPWKCLVENFLFVRKPKKSGGKRGRAGGGGIFCSA